MRTTLWLLQPHFEPTPKDDMDLWARWYHFVAEFPVDCDRTNVGVQCFHVVNARAAWGAEGN